MAGPDWSDNPVPIPYGDLTHPQSLNLYGYVGNDPLIGRDFDGHVEWAEWQSLKHLFERGKKGAERTATRVGQEVTGQAEFSWRDPEDRTGFSHKLGQAFNKLVPFAAIALATDGVSVESELSGALSVESSTAAQLTSAAETAAGQVGEGSGAAYGTRVHSAFEAAIDSLADPNLSTEVSYLNGRVVPRGTLGSVRLDVVEGSVNNPTAIYDLKTGSRGLSPQRIQQIQSHLPGGNKTPVYEVTRPN